MKKVNIYDIITIMEKTRKNFHSGRAIFFLLVILCCIIVGAVLKIASSVILPFVIAVLLAFAMYPLVNFLDKHKIPRFISILLVVFIIVAGLYIFGMVIFTSGTSILYTFPTYEDRVTEIYEFIASFLELPFDETMGVWENLWGQLGVRSWVMGIGRDLGLVVLNFTTSAVMVILFVVFILLEASIFRSKLEAAFENPSDRVNRIGKAIITDVTRYLTAKFFISLATGILIALGLSFIGVEFAVLWGVVSFVMNFIPILGSITGGVAMSLFSLIQFWPNQATIEAGGLWAAMIPVVLTIILVLSVNMVVGNFLDPKIVGKHVGVSPLVVLISLSIWGYIWGFAGMVLAVPLTSIIKIVCENIPIMEPVSILIGTKRGIAAKINWKLPGWKFPGKKGVPYKGSGENNAEKTNEKTKD